MTVTKLESGYWLVRWSQNRWLQWPVGRAPTKEDGFGWITDAMLQDAAKITGGAE